MSTQLKLPRIRNQTAFNLECWDSLVDDVLVRNWPGRVETDRFGRRVFIQHEVFEHGLMVAELAFILGKRANGGKTSLICPISTSAGVKVADVAWITKARLLKIGGRTALKGAPEICVEVISPSNTKEEIQEKRRLYFEAGAQEVWICDRKGKMFFFLSAQPDKSVAKSRLCPEMPKVVS